MPIHDFRCADCGHEFEAQRALGSTRRAACPECGGAKTEKVFGVAGIVFNCGGFYATDSKSKQQERSNVR